MGRRFLQSGGVWRRERCSPEHAADLAGARGGRVWGAVRPGCPEGQPGRLGGGLMAPGNYGGASLRGVTREGLAASGRRVIGLRLTRGEVWWIGSKGWHPPERQSGREDRPLGIVILDVDA